jgi:hypothetical protein
MKKLLDDKSINLIGMLPEEKLIADRLNRLTAHQKQEWESLKNRWYILGKELDYIQGIDCGLINTLVVKSPLDDCRIHPALQVALKIEADWLFAIFKLMIAGWKPIVNAARENNREFNFKHPRELFIEFCKQNSQCVVEYFLTEEINQGESLGDFRDWFKVHNEFYRDRLEDPKEGEDKKKNNNKVSLTEMLNNHKNSKEWDRFIIYAIWNYRHDPKNNLKIYQAWNEFLRTYKSLVKSIRDKRFYSEYDTRLFMTKWNQGHPVFSDTCKPVPLAEVPLERSALTAPTQTAIAGGLEAYPCNAKDGTVLTTLTQTAIAGGVVTFIKD